MNPVTTQTRDISREEVKQWIRDLEINGISIYKISIMCHRHFSTVKNWKERGKVEAVDWKMLQEMHNHYCKG